MIAVGAVLAAFAVLLGLVAKPAQGAPAPISGGALNIEMRFTGEYLNEPYDFSIDSQGSITGTIDWEAGEGSYQSTLSPGSFGATLVGSSAEVDFELVQPGPVSFTFNTSTLEAEVPVHLLATFPSMLISNTPPPVAMNDCVVEITLNLTGSYDGGAGAFVLSQTGGTFDPGQSQCTFGEGGTAREIIESLLSGGTSEITASLQVGDRPAGTVPSAPLNTQAVAGPLQAEVSWGQPLDDGGRAITGYAVYVVGQEEPIAVTSSQVHVIDVIGLTEGVEYQFEVTALNEIGPSEPSEPSNAVVILEANQSFTDVPGDHPFFAEITWLAETGITTGFPDDTFRPRMVLTRQAMAAFLYRMAGQPDFNVPDEPSFTDVPVDHQFFAEIEWLVETGITTGFPDETFRPTLGLSRQGMAAFLYRAADSPNGADPTCATAPFSDVPTTHTFCGEIAWLKGTGITTGDGNNEFRPGADLTRQAMAAFLYRYTLVEPGIVTPTPPG